MMSNEIDQKDMDQPAYNNGEETYQEADGQAGNDQLKGKKRDEVMAQQAEEEEATNNTVNQ